MALSMKNSPELTQEEVLPFLIQPLEAASVVLAAQPNIYDSPTGDPLRIPKLVLGDDPGWYAENEQIGESDPDFNEVVLLPNTLKSLKVIHRFSNELARHSVISIANSLQATLVRQVADAWDTAALVGTGTADVNGNHPVKGLWNQAGVQTATYDDTDSGTVIDSTVDAFGKLVTADISDFSRTVWFVATDVYLDMLKVKTTDGRPLLQPDVTKPGTFTLQGFRVVPTSKLPAGGQLLVDMSQVAVGRDLSPSVKILDQTFGDYDQLAIRVVARMDIGLLHPEGVVKITPA